MPLQQSSSAKGSGHHDDPPTDRFRHGGDKGDQGKGKGKGKAKGPGIPVPDDCEIFVDNKQLCKKWQVGRCSAKVKAGKRCMIGWHLCWKKNCHRAHPGNECPGNGLTPGTQPREPCYVHLGLPCGTCCRRISSTHKLSKRSCNMKHNEASDIIVLKLFAATKLS